jgi:hypothetical protein
MNKTMNRVSPALIFLILVYLASGCGGTDGPVSPYPAPGPEPVIFRVSPKGNDHNSGSENEPLRTLSRALRKARELRRLNDPCMEDGIIILLEEGVYQLDEPVVIRPEDSGSKSSPTIIRADRGDQVVLSGGITLKGWEKPTKMPAGLPPEAKGKIWAADIPVIWNRQLDFRQMWVNGEKAHRASNLHDGSLDRILASDSLKEEIWIPVPSSVLHRPERTEFVIHQWWAIANLRIKSMDIEGGKARLRFHQPESRVEFEHPWPAPFIDRNNEYNGNSAFYLVNDIGLLNRPGEWFRDPGSGKVYYWPGEDEDMATADVTIPVLETLLRIEGSIDNPVSHVHFEGIRFEHTGWLRPSREGHVPLQAGMYITDAYKLLQPGTPDKQSLENQAWIGRQPAALIVKNASNASVRNCVFTHLAATGIDLISGSKDGLVEGCVFRDIGGTAIQLGFFGDRSTEAHLPYNPSDKREICHHIRIENNLITDCTNEDWGCVGISVGYAHDITIEYNEISHINYSGICVGWGWTKTISCMKNNRVHANHIHHFARQMYDVGGIYTLSAQPATEISRNRIEHLEKAPYAHIPDHFQYIYLDEGSSYIKVIDNWTEKDKFFSNTPGPGNEWINNGPGVSAEIKESAGLTEEFRYLLNNTGDSD